MGGGWLGGWVGEGGGQLKGVFNQLRQPCSTREVVAREEEIQWLDQEGHTHSPSGSPLLLWSFTFRRATNLRANKSLVLDHKLVLKVATFGGTLDESPK